MIPYGSHPANLVDGLDKLIVLSREQRWLEQTDGQTDRRRNREQPFGRRGRRLKTDTVSFQTHIINGVTDLCSHLPLRTIDNALYLVWSNQDPSIQPTVRVQNLLSGNGKLRKNHNIKVNQPRNYIKYLRGRHVNITKPIIYRFFMHLTSFVVYILVKFYWFTNPLYSILRPELTNRDSEHYWWSLLPSLEWSRETFHFELHSPNPGVFNTLQLKKIHFAPVIWTWIFKETFL